MSQNPEMPLPVNSTPRLTTCSNCHSAMPSELRFCRNCGFRLGDGQEYTETVRFAGEHGRLVPGSSSAPLPAKKRRRMSGMAWVFIGLLVFFVGAAAFTAVMSPRRERVSSIVHKAEPRSYTGVREWSNVSTPTTKGVTFECVTPPGGPADKAGLVGGDVIVTFDGQPVANKDELNQVLVRTPVGKVVDVQYLRDGELHETKLQTVSEEELKKLNAAFDDRPGPQRAVFGYDNDDVERVPIPGTPMFGVRLDDVFASRPADLAGVRNGDVVIEFDGIPIRTPDELLMRVRRAVPYSTVKLVVMRGDEKVEIPVKMGRQ